MQTAFTLGAIAVKWWQLSAAAFIIVGGFAFYELNSWPLIHSGGSGSSSVQMCSP